jgi:16S rRNA (cytidine1402-2'-O)-methyltransferase
VSAAGGTLHLVPVPISPRDQWQDSAPADILGGLAPATLAVARRTQYFLAENARSARAFLKAIGHPAAIASLDIVEIGHAPDPAQIDGWLDPLDPRDSSVAVDAVVLAEAGCPGIADPGASVVARAHARGITVMPWVGPSSILLALMGAGMNGQSFRFLGYLPQDRGALQERLQTVQRDAQRGETQVFIETPYRNVRLLQTLLQTCDGALQLCVAVDLTAAGQIIATHSIAQWKALGPGRWPALDRRTAVFLLCASTVAAGSPPAKVPAPRRR